LRDRDRAAADDSVAIARAGCRLVASGLPAAYFLRAATAATRDLVPVPPAQRTRAAPLGAIFVLDRSSEGPAFERLAPVEAVEHMLRHRHRPQIPLVLGRIGRTFDDCVFLARSVPIFLWRRRDGAVRLSDEEISALARGAQG
jgi:hypothetical protein